MHDDMDDARIDNEANNLKIEQTKEIDALGFSQEEFDSIEQEFTEFLSEHLQNKDLEAFKQQYQKIHQNLHVSYEGEKKLIRKCKELITQIFDKAQNYRAALRVATNETEKIDQLKKEQERCYELQQ